MYVLIDFNFLQGGLPKINKVERGHAKLALADADMKPYRPCGSDDMPRFPSAPRAS
jgi:hypothetical protein